MTPNEIEKRVVESFVVPSRRARYLEALSRPKKRAKILDRLNHRVDDLDDRYRVQIPRGTQAVQDIESALAAKGAPSNCYVISSWGKFDGMTMALREALKNVIGSGMGTVISCIPGRLAYYETEYAGDRFILERTAV